MNSHQIVDLIVLAVLLYCAVRGAARGLLSQLAWVVALVLCFRFSGALAPAIEPMIGVQDPRLRQWIAMLAVYVGLCGLSFVAAGMLSSWMEKIRLRDFDRHLGAVLGVVKGTLFCMTIMYFAITKSEPMRQIVSRTYSGYAAAEVLDKSRFLIGWVPEANVPEVQEVIDRFRQRLRQGADELQGATPTGPGWTSGEPDAEGQDGDVFRLEDLIGEPRRDSEASSGSSKGSQSEPTLTDVLSRLPSHLRDQLSRKALDTIRQTTAEEKQRLIDLLAESAPQDSSTVLNDFFRELAGTNGTGSGTTGLPAGRPESDSFPTELGRAESQLLNEIAAIYGGRYDVVPRARKYLAGLPADVQRQVLSDWHADTLGHSGDPDPATDVDTRLDERILRQLQKSGIPLNRLDRELRSRLTMESP
jgi:membrane protein required for colicin V production